MGSWQLAEERRAESEGFRFLVLGSWFLVLGSWFLVLGAWCVVLGAWCVVLGAWFLVRGAWCVVRGAWCVVRGAWLKTHVRGAGLFVYRPDAGLCVTSLESMQRVAERAWHFCS